MKATIDRDLCISCGVCEGKCPQVFELDDECIAISIVEEIDPKDLVLAKKTMKTCPVNAIDIK
ncbi:ferredoxin [uncultured Clostridium sp.]|uniref:ferredoxin n=1 Tax=uncultured Clostridium sp. TaxID=59620 RepID=UPI00261B20C0|nr:ferredoxin [uncultured Clostridium sp.]